MKRKFNKILVFSTLFFVGLIDVGAAACGGIKVNYASLQLSPKIADAVEYVCKDYNDIKYTYTVKNTGTKILSGYPTGRAAFDACKALPDVVAKDDGSTIKQMSHAPYRNSWLDQKYDTDGGCDKKAVYGTGECTYTTSESYDTCGGECTGHSTNKDGSQGPCNSWAPTYKCCKGSKYTGCGACCLDHTFKTSKIDIDSTPSTVVAECSSSGHSKCRDGSVNANIKYTSYDKYCKNPVLDLVDVDAWHYIVGEGDAHCINPGKHFGDDAEDGTNYLWDSSFDVTKCKSSLTALDADGNVIDEEGFTTTGANQNSRKVCGFTNILVMGKYLNYSPEVISAAMRLFSYHVDDKYNFISSSGFGGNGLPIYPATIRGNVETDEGLSGPCKFCMRFFNDNHPRGMGNKDLIEYNHYINTYNYLKYGTLTVPRTWNNKWYKGGFLANVEDISEVKGPEQLAPVSCSIDKDHIGLWCTASTNGTTEYLKSLYLFINTIQGNDRLQYYINELTGNETTQYEPMFVRTSLSKEIVNNYGELTITAEMKDNVEVECDKDDPATKEYCKVERIYVNVNGQSYSYDDRDAYYDYCKKNYCYKVVKYYMNVCTNNVNSTATGDVEVAIITKKTKAQAAVKKLVPCGNPENSQNMYTLDLTGNVKNSRAIKTKQVGRKTYNLDNYTISETTQSIQLCNCPDNTCRTSNKKYLLITTPDGNTYSDINQAKGKNFCAGYNKFDDGNYNSYAYSKVEDPTMNCILNMCYSADKAKYDYSGYYGVNTDVCRVYCRDEVHMFMADKTEAYAGMQFKYDIAGKVFMGRPRSDEVNALTTIVVESRQCVSDIFYDRPNEDGKTWLDMMDEATNKHQNKNTAAQLIIDLENCNLVSNISSNYTTQYNNVHYPIYNKKNLKDSSQNKTTLKLIHELYNASEGGERNNICNGKACASGHVEYENERVNLDVVDSITISPVSYCNGDSCFAFAKNGDPTKTYISGSYETTSMSTILGNVTVPINDFAQITIKYEADLFNPKKYQVNKYTGVYEESNGDTSKIQLEPYSYPVSLELQTDVYPVKHHYDIKSFYRNTTNQDGFAEVLTGDGALANYTCGYDIYNTTVKYPTKCYYINNGIPDIFGRSNCPDTTPTDIHYGFVYRNIDLANVFPNVRGYDTNWSTPEGRKAIREIEDSSSDLQVTTKYLQYSYVLSPEAIKSIRADYNSLHKTNLGYINDTLYDCSIVTSESGHNSYRNCKSEFVNELANMTNRFGIVVKKGDGVAAGGED